MPRNGVIRMDGLVVQSVDQRRQRTVLIAKNDDYTITIEKNGKLPDDMYPRPDGTLDVRVDYDPK